MKKIQKSFICLLLSVGLLGNAPFSKTYKSLEANPFCITMRSKQISDEVFKTFVARLDARIRDHCSVREAPVDDIFSLTAMSEIKKQSPRLLMGFWLDMANEGRSYLMRGLDMQSQLEWAQAKVAAEGLTATAKARSLGGMIDKLLEAFPFVGILIPEEGFFSWIASPSTVQLVTRKKTVERHPLLPKIIRFKVESTFKGWEGRILQHPGDIWELRSTSTKKLKLKPTEIYWLKSSAQP